jgi:hypothetical protein
VEGYEKRHSDASKVLDHVGEVVKQVSSQVVTADDIGALSSLVDSYTRLFGELQK